MIPPLGSTTCLFLLRLCFWASSSFLSSDHKHLRDYKICYILFDNYARVGIKPTLERGGSNQFNHYLFPSKKESLIPAGPVLVLLALLVGGADLIIVHRARLRRVLGVRRVRLFRGGWRCRMDNLVKGRPVTLVTLKYYLSRAFQIREKARDVVSTE